MIVTVNFHVCSIQLKLIFACLLYYKYLMEVKFIYNWNSAYNFFLVISLG